MADLTYLPSLAAPICQVFKTEHLVAFEFMVMFFFNWGCDWLQFHPGAPVGTLMRATALLEAADPELAAHLQSCSAQDGDANSSVGTLVLWPLLQTLLAQVLSPRDWLALWDHLIFRWREPELLMACAVCILFQRKSALLAIPATGTEALQQELTKRHEGGQVRDLLGQAEALLQKP